MIMISVYTLTYNEELLIQFMIDHYRFRFPNCNITIYDNSSTDKTVEIAKKNNCVVIPYDSNNTLDDELHMKIKNNCWKKAETDWVLVCDLDELLDIDVVQLEKEELMKITRIKSEAWSMVNLENNYNIFNIKYAVRQTPWDKYLLFNKKYISEINYGAGCHPHDTFSNGIVRDSSKAYKLFHYKYINPDLAVLKASETCKRISNKNIANKWGLKCFRTDEELKQEFEELRKIAIKIL